MDNISGGNLRLRIPSVSAPNVLRGLVLRGSTTIIGSDRCWCHSYNVPNAKLNFKVSVM